MSPEHRTLISADRNIRPLLWRWIAFAVCAAAIITIIVVGETLRGGHQFWWDDAVLRALRRPDATDQTVGPAWLLGAMVNVTALGSGVVLIIAVILATGSFIIARRWLTAATLVMGTVSGSIAISFAKSWFARPRPAVVPHLVDVSSLSFPSAHSANSAMVYLLLAAMLAQVVADRRQRRYVMLTAILLIGAIGTSRVYLGVHYPSDVLAGWCFGLLWAALWWFLLGWAEIRFKPNMQGKRLSR